MNARISKTLLTIAGAAAIGLATLPSTAAAGEVHNRTNRQQTRIDNGVSNGSLTRREYIGDERRLDRVEYQRNRDLRNQNGHLTAGEKAHFNRELNRNSRDIYFTKHNLRDQPGH